MRLNKKNKKNKLMGGIPHPYGLIIGAAFVLFFGGVIYVLKSNAPG